MALVCYTPIDAFAPWRPLSALRSEIQHSLGWMPAVDVRESEDAYTFEVDVPGLTKENVHIEAEGNTVTIRGERKQEENTSRGAFRRTERRYGRFERSFELGDGFDAGRIEAHLEHGVLRVTLPKRDEAKPKHIQVTVN